MENSGQRFGGDWTVIKLDKVEKYLDAYTTALKRVKFKLCYIDAFAGNGAVKLNDLESTDGSALRALKYPFDRFYYIDCKQENCQKLDEIRKRYPDREIYIDCCDSNDALSTIHQYDWIRNGWRGVIFLDPYAMDLDWASLENIAKTEAFDVWYLFPLSALLRNLANDSGAIKDSNFETITRFLGTDEWYSTLYRPYSFHQTSFFNDEDDEETLKRVGADHVIEYILKRLGTLFTVSDTPLILRNGRNSPLFLLCFMVSSKNSRAIEIAMRIARHILTH